jgi:hypothetical protein
LVNLGPIGSAASSLEDQHSAGVIGGVTADEFFPDLLHRLESLDSLSSPPLTEEMAIARLKKLLPYRESFIEIRDILGEEIDRIQQAIQRRGYLFPDGNQESQGAGLREIMPGTTRGKSGPDPLGGDGGVAGSGPYPH